MNKEINIKNVDMNLLKLQYDAVIRCVEDTKEEEEKNLLRGVLELFDNISEDTGMFNIPSMCISKDDIKSMYEGRDDFEEICEQVNKISDEDMQCIANNMTDAIMDDYWGVLEVIYDNYKNGDYSK